MSRSRSLRGVQRAVVFAALLFPAVPAAGLDVVWVYPVPNSLVTESPVPLLGYLRDGTVSSLRVEVRSSAGQAAARAQDLFLFKGRVFSASVELTPGRNDLTVGDRTLSLLYRPGAKGERDGDFRRVSPHADVTKGCGPCHGFAGGRITLAKAAPDLCLDCHGEAAAWLGAEGTGSVHRREINRDCSRCHEAHASLGKGMLRVSAEGPCAACHEEQGRGADAHAAYEEGGCLACHRPHPDGQGASTRAPVPELCAGCHDQGGSAPGRHPAMGAERSCAACHDPHGTAGKLLAAPPGPALCGACHGEVLTKGHGRDLEECNRCHEPHGKVGGGLLRRGVGDVCRECHDDVAAGRVVHAALEEGCETCHSPHAEGAEAARPSCDGCHDLTGDGELASLHGRLTPPVGACLSCHRPHASYEPDLLRGRAHFPILKGTCKACHGEGVQKSLSVPAPAERCRSCHAFQREMEAKGTPLHDPVASGDCLECHEPHLSTRPRLLRASEAKVCGECHDLPGPGEGRAVHPAAETCSDCHAAHGGERKRFLKEQLPALCFECHDDPSGGGAEVHPALEAGCLSCHDPHGGWAAGSLKAKPVATCLECHDDPAAGLARRHGAVDRGCSGCHEPHASRNAHFLRERGAALCSRCHDVAKPAEGRTLHPPAEECGDCHEGTSHGGAKPRLLRQAPPALCLDCHDDPREKGGELHPALEEGCLVCHAPHQGFTRGLLRGGTATAACLECHDDPASGFAVPHRPVAESCAACHEPHAGKNPSLLKARGSALCLGCHQLPAHHHSIDAVAGVERFPGAADFPAEGGRFACAGCHLPHGADAKGLLRPKDEICGACHQF